MCRRGGDCIEVGTEEGLRFEHALRAAYQDIACGSASAGVGPYGSVGVIWSIRSPGPYHPVGALRGIEWVVYTKRPFAGPEQVLAYLGRCTHRVAIANSRLIGCTTTRSTSPGRTTGITARPR